METTVVWRQLDNEFWLPLDKYGELGKKEWLMRRLPNFGLKSVVLLKSAFIFVCLVSHFSWCWPIASKSHQEKSEHDKIGRMMSWQDNVDSFTDAKRFLYEINFSEVTGATCGARSLVLCVVFCTSLFVCFTFSIVLSVLLRNCGFWSLYLQTFFLLLSP